MGSPAMGARGFPGKRVELYLDGIKAITFIIRGHSSPDQEVVYVAQAESDSHTVTSLTFMFPVFRVLASLS